MNANTNYMPAEARYTNTSGWFRRCGRSGLQLPLISMGCWHNFGDPGTDAAHHHDEASMHENAKAMLFASFDNGITHFDLANCAFHRKSALIPKESAQPFRRKKRD